MTQIVVKYYYKLFFQSCPKKATHCWIDCMLVFRNILVYHTPWGSNPHPWFTAPESHQVITQPTQAMDYAISNNFVFKTFISKCPAPKLLNYSVLLNYSITSPVLESQQWTQVVADERRNPFQVVRSHPRREEWLVGIAECRVHQQKTFVFTNFLGKTLRTLLVENIFPPAGWCWC